MSSLPLMCVYTVLAIALQALAIVIVMIVEPMLGGWSGATYMGLFLLAFWVAWVIAVRVTEPKKAAA